MLVCFEAMMLLNDKINFAIYKKESCARTTNAPVLGPTENSTNSQVMLLFLTNYLMPFKKKKLAQCQKCIIL